MNDDAQSNSKRHRANCYVLLKSHFDKVSIRVAADRFSTKLTILKIKKKISSKLNVVGARLRASLFVYIFTPMRLFACCDNINRSFIH